MPKDRRFVIEVRGYEPGLEPDELTLARIESAFAAILDNDGSDGVVIVSEDAHDPEPYDHSRAKEDRRNA